jgi:hypothetical protein
MPEMSAAENEVLGSRVYTRALHERHAGRELDRPDLMVYHIEMLSQEALEAGTSLHATYTELWKDLMGRVAASNLRHHF